MESHLEARLWNDIFNLAQDIVGLPRGTIRGTVLIETILAVFEMDEIIYELRQHSSGLNCGRWDYIFSVIKKFRNNPQFILPDRSAVTMTVPFMDAYVKLLIKTCHRRGVHAMGGMAAQIPIKDDPEANKKAMEGVYADKLREVRAGHEYVTRPRNNMNDRELLTAFFFAVGHGNLTLFLTSPQGENWSETNIICPGSLTLRCQRLPRMCSINTCQHPTRYLSAVKMLASPQWTCST